MKWWPYIDGGHLSRNVDLQEKFEQYDSERSMNIIDNLLVEESIANTKSEDAILKLRTKIDEVYGRINSGTDAIIGDTSVKRHTNYIQPTEDGYAGLEAPLG